MDDPSRLSAELGVVSIIREVGKRHKNSTLYDTIDTHQLKVRKLPSHTKEVP